MIDLILHDTFVDALSKVQRTVEAARDGSTASCGVLDGPSGSGKSLVLKYLLAQHPEHREAEGLKVPVLRIPMPSNPTIKGVATLIIDAVGDGVPVKGNETAVTERAKRQLNNADTNLLIFDDAQHVVDHCSTREQLRFTDWLKHLVDETGTALLLAGLPRVHHLIALNEQLQRRFNSTAHLRRLAWTDEGDRDRFLDTLATIQAQLKDYQMPELDSDALGFRMYAATGGLLGYLVKLIEEAVRIARRAESREITVETLAEAHAFAVYRKAPGVEAPFDMKIDLEPDSETLAHVEAMGMGNFFTGEVLDREVAR